METGEKVRKARRQALLTQGELAALAGVGITTIVRVERGQVEAHPHTLRLLARALDVRAVALVADEEPPGNTNASKTTAQNFAPLNAESKDDRKTEAKIATTAGVSRDTVRKYRQIKQFGDN